MNQVYSRVKERRGLQKPTGLVPVSADGCMEMRPYLFDLRYVHCVMFRDVGMKILELARLYVISALGGTSWLRVLFTRVTFRDLHLVVSIILVVGDYLFLLLDLRYSPYLSLLPLKFWSPRPLAGETDEIVVSTSPRIASFFGTSAS